MSAHASVGRRNVWGGPSMRARSSALTVLAAALSAVLLFGGCGGDDQATEQRIERERAEPAVIAKQEERIKQLERKQRETRRSGPRQPSVTVVTPPPNRPNRAAGPAPATTDDWPGGAAYTTILESVSSESEARRVQAAATARGLDAGVLYSTNYRSLRPGFWVVFSGTSSSKQDADRRTQRARSLGYRGAYPRFVSG